MEETTDHDILIRHDTILGRVEANVDTNAKQAIARDTELRVKIDGIRDSIGELGQRIRDIQQTERTNSADRTQLWERVKILWDERVPAEARRTFVKQHQSLWNAFTIARFIAALFVIEQPIIIGIVVTILARQ